MQTDYAQILPIILPVPKAGPNAPANVASADGKTTSPTRAEATDLDAIASEEGSDDLSQSPSAFDQALAQMMMVQVPVQAAKPAPQAPSQQGLATNPIDITAALDALKPGADIGLAQAMDAGSDLKAPLMTAPAPSDRLPDPNLQAVPQGNGAAQTLPAAEAELALAIGAAVPEVGPSNPAPQVAIQNAPTQAANFAESAPVAVISDDAAQALFVTTAAAGPTVSAPAFVERLQSKPVDLALSTPKATTAQVQPSAPEAIKAEPAPDAASAVPSIPFPVQASADRQSQNPILQAMGNAASDPTARVMGNSVDQPKPQNPILQAMGNAASDPTARVMGNSVDQQTKAPNLAALTAPEPDQAQSAGPAQTTPQATTTATNQVLASAQAGVRQKAQANSRATTVPIASGEVTSTSTPSISTPLTAVAIATNGGAASADTGGSFEDAPTDLADTAAAKAAQSDSEASTDIFGAPLPLEGRVTQASLQAGSSATLSTPATAPHLAAEISRKFEGKSAQFDISLTPEGLGKVDVKITINARGEVSAAMKFDNPQAAAELKGRAAELQRALEQSGFSLSQDGISFSDGQGQGFNAPQQQASQQDWQETARRTAQNRLFQDTNDLADAAALRVAEASSAYSRRSNTGVDVRI